MKRTITPIILLLLCFVQTYGQTCGTPDNISQTVKDGENAAGDQFAFYQTFTPDCNGAMESFTIWHTNLIARGATLFIAQGANPNSSTILQTWNYTFPTSPATPPFPSVQTRIDLPATQNLTAGVVYAFAIVMDNPGDNISFDLATDDQYPQGNAFWVDTGATTWEQASTFGGALGITDMHFRIGWADQTPYVTCRQGRSFALGTDGTVSVAFSQVSGGSGASEGESVIIRNIFPSSFDCDDVGPQTVSLTVQDTSGQNAICSTTIFITDGQDPVLSCPEDITVNVDPFSAAFVTYDAPTVDDCTAATPNGFTHLGVYTDPDGDIRNYYLSDDPIELEDGEDLAEALGGFLVTVIDANHNDWIRDAVNFVTGQTDVQVLLGYTDRNSEGFYRWHAGNENAGYENWNAGEPNNLGDEDFAVQLGDGRWNDLNRNAQRRYLIQTEGQSSSATLISGIASGEEFPVGTTTNTYEVVDAYGNSATCSFDVTVIENQFEVLVELESGKLKITDIGDISDIDLTVEETVDGNGLFLYDLPLTQISAGITRVNPDLFSVNKADIPNGIEFIGGGGTNTISFVDNITLSGVNTDIVVSNLGTSGMAAFENTGHLNIGGALVISNSSAAAITLGELTAANLSVTGVNTIKDASGTTPINIAGQTDLQATGGINIQQDATHSFAGNVNLAGSVVTFSTTGPLTLGAINATNTGDSFRNSIRTSSGSMTLTGDIVTAGNSDLYLRAESSINQSAGIITTDRLFLDGSSITATTATFFGDNDINTLEVEDSSLLGLIVFNNISELEIGSLEIISATVFAPIINLNDQTDIQKIGDGVVTIGGDGIINIISDDSPAYIDQDGGVVEFVGATINIESLNYLSFSGSDTRFLGNTYFIPEADSLLDLQFGSIEVQGIFDLGNSDIQITAIDDVDFQRAETIVSGQASLLIGDVEVRLGATLQPGGGSTPATLTTASIEFNQGTFAPLVQDATSFDVLNVAGTVTLTDAEFAPTGGSFSDIQEIVLIENDGLPEGSPISLGAYRGFISYEGGDGNDLSLNTYETRAIFAEGEFTIFDDIGFNSDDTFTISVTEGVLRVSDLTTPVGVFGDPGVTLVSPNTVEIPLANISDGFIIGGGDGVDTVTILNDLTFNNTVSNFIVLDEIENFNQPGALDLGGFLIIRGTGTSEINLGEITARGLDIGGFLGINDSSSPITVNGPSYLYTQGPIVFDEGQGNHQFEDKVFLGASYIEFTSGSDTSFGTITTTETGDVINEIIVNPGNITLDGDVSIASNTLSLGTLGGNIVQNSGTIETTLLGLRGGGAEQ